MDQPGNAANPACGQLHRENNIPLSPCVPENQVGKTRKSSKYRDLLWHNIQAKNILHSSYNIHERAINESIQQLRAPPVKAIYIKYLSVT